MSVTINNRYQLHNKIGQGGMGIVHQATDRLTGEIIAVKQIRIPTEQLEFMSRPDSVMDRNLRLALAQEFQILAGLRHPHIISVLDYGFDSIRQPFFTMTYLPDAQTILEAGANLDSIGKAELVRQILQALAYLHRWGIIHRDLKPPNVLVSQQMVQVLDFGLSIAKGMQQNGVGGSLFYLAPELLRREAASQASDLYAVGVIAYELFTGRHPFDTVSSKFAHQVRNDLPDLSCLGLDKALTAVIGRLLAKKPADRFDSADACLGAINAALGETVWVKNSAIQESYLQAAIFVGRDKELTKLTDALSQAKAGRGSVWLIGGESGVGKSRLLSEIRNRALVGGFLVLNGQGTQNMGVPHQLLQDPLRHLLVTLDDVDDLTASVLRPLIPDIETLLGRRVNKAPPLEPVAARQRLFLQITQLIKRQKQPVLLILDDLQWVRAGLNILPYLIHRIDHQSFLIIGSYRNDERFHLPEFLLGVNQLTLSRLSEENISELSRAILGEIGQQPEILTLLHRETEGNAFFLVEMVRALAEEAGHLNHIGQMMLPETLWPKGVQSIIQRRLNRVPEEGRSLLQLAAVIGCRIELRLMQICSGNPDLIKWWLSVCAEASVLEIQGGLWRFAHDKLREGVLQTLGPTVRRALHRQVAQGIETLYGNESGKAAILTYHWQQAHEPDLERHYAYLAGLHAFEQYANEEAIIFLSWAYDLTSKSDIQTRYTYLLTREEVFDRLGQREAQKNDLVQLVQLAEQLEQPAAKDQVTLRQVNYLYALGMYKMVVERVQAAIAQTQVNGHQANIARLHLLWGRSLWELAEYPAAAKQCERAYQLAKEAGLDRVMVFCLRYLGTSSGSIDHSQSKRYYEQGLAIARRIGDQEIEGQQLNRLGMQARRQYTTAIAYMKQGLSISQEIGNRLTESTMYNDLGLVFGLAGHYEQAQEYLEQCLMIAGEIDSQLSISLALSNLGWVAFRQGRYSKAKEHLEQTLTITQKIGTPRIEGITHHCLGQILCAEENYNQARKHYQTALNIRQSINQLPYVIEDLTGLVQIALMQNEVTEPHLARILAYLADNPELMGTLFPYRVYLICYQALQANDDKRAEAILKQGYGLLQAEAKQIDDEFLRGVFLENVAEHREIVHLYQVALKTIDRRYTLHK